MTAPERHETPEGRRAVLSGGAAPRGGPRRRGAGTGAVRIAAPAARFHLAVDLDLPRLYRRMRGAARIREAGGFEQLVELDEFPTYRKLHRHRDIPCPPRRGARVLVSK